MIRRFQLRYAFVGNALVWLQSYLEGRTQRVVISDASSITTRVTSGVPQGSVTIAIFAVRTAHWRHHYSALTLFSSLC